MQTLLLPNDMRAGEARYFECAGIRSIDAMERAATALADAVRKMVPAGSRVVFVCGNGRNGGDGLACARILKDEYSTQIVLPRPPRSEDAVQNLERAKQAGVPISEEVDQLPDLWVDALFGTGLSREPDGIYACWIDRMNADKTVPILAADIPSGLNGATGRAYAHCVHASRTITFGFGKTGLYLQDGFDMCGTVQVANIGFPETYFSPAVWMTEKKDLTELLPKRNRRNTYKNLFGHLLIVAGSFGMAGAAALCARSAMRTGVGLVTIACPESIVPILQTLVPGAMCLPIAEKDGAIADAEAVQRAFAGKTAVAIGCGLSTRANPEFVKAVLQSNLPAVIDADAINLIAENGFHKLLRPHHVITPHPGEARRLLKSVGDSDELLADPIAVVRTLNGLGACALFKGASCVISDSQNTYLSASGCSGMSCAGSGDVLTGIIGALLADVSDSDRKPALCAALGSEIHGLAGELAQKKRGVRGMIAEDLPECIAEVLHEC